jgi:hypothetical protein
MADTDLPNGFGALPSAPTPRPRPIASPFGIFPDPWQTPNPNQTPGFNVQPDAASTNPMASLLASLTPSRQDVAETLGGPVDMLGYVAHRMGLAVPGGSAPPEYAPSPGTVIQPWIPSADVPLSSRNIRGMLDNPPSWDAMLRAMRRPGLF